ncbi:DUF7344 domain-containing protein [Natronolimnohabitans innermongolicus]|uniref:DUF7344 domain-containing protein n=1 Tax=Natronolimnohabitans innermongolicus JCM 12255 TaxID=1227499 RepID=L9XGD9_9EURY|nr:hypothetical protein [Natronolimnohabitans innermongolicus]ELY60799.1 hypothetical protein C493_03817 [Natronolimnohabitans innermongolicus JCM 12255]
MDNEWLRAILETTEEVERNTAADHLLWVLSDRYTRYVLASVVDESTVTLEALTDVVAGLEAAETGSIVTSSDHERIRLWLYHVVLPKLDDVGYLEFDSEAQTVETDEIPPVFRELLENRNDEV